MAHQKIQSHWPVLRAMLFATGVCLLLFIVRCCMIGKLERAGIYTNIFLAWIPYIVALVLDGMLEGKRAKSWLFWSLLLVWLLFLPNAAYIITDLTHWRKDKILPVWYDWIFISAIAWVGLFLAFLSVQILQRHIARKYGALKGWCFVLLALSASSFGIYVGRFFRWNSWDALIRQNRMFGGLDAMMEPETQWQIASFCTSFTVFSLMVYVMLHAVSHIRLEAELDSGEDK